MNASSILLMDDSSSARFLARTLLNPLQADIKEASDGLEGLDLVLNKHFDIVITDVDMPKMTGLEFCRSLKSVSSCRSIPVVMISTFDSENDILRGFDAGVEAYVPKSDLNDQLLPTVKRVLSKASFFQEKIILVVDDSSSIRNMLEVCLSKAGFQVVTAENGKIALTCIRKKLPDLIISDINMPEMNGFELCAAIKENEKTASIPFLVMSTNKDRGHMKKMIEYGAASYIVKPFNLDQLVILVEKLLSDHFLLLLKDRERLENERGLMLGAITSLISALEARDAYTRGHSEAVARILSQMVELIGADQHDVEAAMIGGRLHDIGKIGVPDSILLKTGQLSKDEFEEIKKHPQIGKSIIESIPSLSSVMDIVHCHHERWDGGGYPLGISGEDIPFWARLTAVADTFHALTSDRPYRKRVKEEKVLEIIRNESGVQFCPNAVNVFLEWYDHVHCFETAN